MAELETRQFNVGTNNLTNHGTSKSTRLFERILMHTHSISDSKRSCSSALKNMDREEKGLESEKYEVVEDGKNTWNVAITKEMVNLITNKTIPVSQRLKKLESLIIQCSDNNDIFDYIMSESLLAFCGNLLSAYCDPSYQDSEELRMLMPLLSLISNNGERTTVLLRQSDFMYNLMRACVTCVTVFLSKSKELLKITWKKKLAGIVKRMGKQNSLIALTQALGVPDFITNDTWTSSKDVPQMENLLLSLFDTTASVTEKDINKYMEALQFPRLPEKNLDSESIIRLSRGLNYGAINNETEEELTDVFIVRVLPFGEIIVYTKEDWKEWLNLINRELEGFLRFKSDKNDIEDEQFLEIETGAHVGFWTTDAKFPGWKPLIMTQCLRGLVLGKAPQNLLGDEDVSWAIWAIDTGTLVFCNRVWPLQISLMTLPPLTSLCFLDAEKSGRNEEEKQFLLIALPLLTQLLSSKPSAARHMVAFGAWNFEMGYDALPDSESLCEGGAFLMLMEYPDAAVRIEFLKLILSLARNSMEVLRYLLECRFYAALTRRLELCAHFCDARSTYKEYWLEIRLMLLILTAIVDGIDKYTPELPGWNCIQRVLIMLTKIEQHPRVKFMAAKCLAILENHKTNKAMVDYHQNGVSFNGNIAKNRRVQTSHDVETGPLVDKAKKASQRTDNKSRKDYCKLFPEIKARELVLTETDDPEPLLSVMDVVDLGDDDDECLQLPPVNAVLEVTSRVDFYTKGYKVNLSNDETHELSLEKTAHQISEKNLSKIICSFLNNGVGGSIYFGIGSESTIEGIRLTRIERDNFRKGIDRMMSRSIFPEVRPTCYDINYVPVLNPGEKSKGLASHKLWVIEIHAKALPHVIYTLASNRKCYVRQGTECVEGMSISMRQEAAEQNRKEIIKAIQDVKAQIPQTKEKLALFIKDYLNKIESMDTN